MWKFCFMGMCAAILNCVPAVREVSADGVATRPAAAVAEANRDVAAVQQALRTYTETFNKHDAAALAALWSPTGFHEDRETGQRLEGRAAIQADLAALFKKTPGIQLGVHGDGVRFISPDVAKVNGAAMVNTPGEEPRETGFSALFIRQRGKWLLDTAEETDTASSAAPGAALKELEWLVGTWKDQSDNVSVETSVRWAPGGAFLIWAYSIKTNDEEKPHEGSQVIGWDPRTKQIRSRTFESDGSFGEGTWSRSGNEWIVRLTYTSADGELATGTQVITKINNNRFNVQFVGLDVDGVPLPSLDPVTVVRVSTAQHGESERR
jgi:uncharacterized protein (TIGR02246 family)